MSKQYDLGERTFQFAKNGHETFIKGLRGFLFYDKVFCKSLDKYVDKRNKKDQNKKD